jgi:hypothetical protein
VRTAALLRRGSAALCAAEQLLTIPPGTRREMFERGFGRARQSMEVSLPEKNIVQAMLDGIDDRNRVTDHIGML